MAKTSLKFNTSAMLNMLVGSLYDTPLVFLRENLQNAYDAVLMRSHLDASFKNPEISLTIDGSKITVSDNGIGMSLKELEENFWTAGKSGKNTIEAKNAGVVGTFGIGALANFGVCKSLEVRSHRYDQKQSNYSLAYKSDLQNIDIEETGNDFRIGTTIIGTLQDGINIGAQEAINYIKKYVEYISIPVFFNGSKISGNAILPPVKGETYHYNNNLRGSKIEFDLTVNITSQNPVKAILYASGIKYDGRILTGEILLNNDRPDIFGLRNGFGLSIIPLALTFRLGGLVNLAMLQPTAGREAIRKDCIETVGKIIECIESQYAEFLSSKEYSDTYRDYLNYVNIHFSNKLASVITILLANSGDKRIKLGDILKEKDRYKYYTGNDKSILTKFAQSGSHLVVVSNDYPRHNIQYRFLTSNGINVIEDKVTVLKSYDYKDLDLTYYAIGDSIHAILERDYILTNNKVIFAEISHNVQYLVIKEKDNDGINVYITPQNSEIKAVINVYDNAYSVFTSIMKDFVRNYLYPQLQPYIPSSQKEGIESICNILRRRQEEFSIEQNDTAALDKAFLLYKEGKITDDEFAGRIRNSQKTSTQVVSNGQVDHVDNILNTTTIQQSQNEGSQDSSYNDAPLPPIMRIDTSTKAKLLITNENIPLIHGYHKFLTLTDKMINEYYVFFTHPHTTRVIWSMHRIIYIFSLINSSYNLYYEMELKKHLSSDLTGGEQLTTTTIITQNKIFIPIPPQLEDYFDVSQGSLRFTIRFDGVDGNLG